MTAFACALAAFAVLITTALLLSLSSLHPRSFYFPRLLLSSPHPPTSRPLPPQTVCGGLAARSCPCLSPPCSQLLPHHPWHLQQPGDEWHCESARIGPRQHPQCSAPRATTMDRTSRLEKGALYTALLLVFALIGGHLLIKRFWIQNSGNWVKDLLEDCSVSIGNLVRMVWNMWFEKMGEWFTFKSSTNNHAQLTLLQNCKKCKVIGAGANGYVWLLQHQGSGEKFALKAIPKSFLDNEIKIERMHRERQIMKNCNHHTCTPLVGAFQDSENLYLLQEYVSGGPLGTHLKARGRSLREAAAKFFAANVLVGLDYLHSRGIILRDLKPDNLLVDPQGYLKLADFGFAEHVGVFGKAEVACGTPHYLAPEVLCGEGGGKEADLWAVGVILFELLHGYVPFGHSANDMNVIFEAIKRGAYIIDPSLCSPSAADLIAKLLNTYPEERIGGGWSGINAVKRHAFFKDFDWVALEQREMRPPTRFGEPNVGNLGIPKHLTQTSVEQQYWDPHEWIIVQ